jgi:hypothetical protein
MAFFTSVKWILMVVDKNANKEKILCRVYIYKQLLQNFKNQAEVR